VLADRIDARKLIRTAQTNSAIAMIMVGMVTLLGVAQLWHLALGAFLLGLSRAAIFEHAGSDRPEDTARWIVQLYLHGLSPRPRVARRAGSAA